MEFAKTSAYKARYCPVRGDDYSLARPASEGDAAPAAGLNGPGLPNQQRAFSGHAKCAVSLIMRIRQ
eukprot:11944905-Alexandrium_andersonii.AAC.1